MILLVEDDAISRTSFAESLCGYGYQVLEAADGAEALALVAKHKSAIELVITDIVLPKMNGFELVENIRALLPRVPIIGLSGYISQAGGDNIFGGDVSFLEKPVRPSALMVLVQRILPRPRNA
jgi:two-component system, cell cycle sensor histidine kinase and response regulator CckA